MRTLRAMSAMRVIGVAGALALGGCSSLGGGASEGTASGGGSTFNNILLGTPSGPPAQPTTSPLQADIKCPPVVIHPGTGAWQVNDGRGTDQASIRYLASFDQLARECPVLGQEVAIRVGFTGRVVVGPKGSSGSTVEVPVRMMLIDKTDKVMLQRVVRVRVQVPAGSPNADFTQVEDLGSLPVPPDFMEGWQVRIGFDMKGTEPWFGTPAAEARRGKRRG